MTFKEAKDVKPQGNVNECTKVSCTQFLKMNMRHGTVA